jgi:hypothetical protein
VQLPKIPEVQWPDLRAFALIASFFITWDLIQVIKDDETLLANVAFMQFAGSISTGTVLVIINYLFGGTRSGSETMAKMSEKLTDGKDKGATP